MEEQEFQPDVPQGKVKRFIKETMRVLRITKKPDWEEYKTLLKVTGIGIAVIGMLGFVIFLLNQLLFQR